MWFGNRLLLKEFHDECNGRHFGYRNGTVLAILNLNVAAMPHHQVSAQSYIHVWFRRCRLKNFNMAATAAILDIETERF